MSFLWLLIMVVSIGALMIVNPSVVISSMINGANQSVQLAISLVAVYGVWLGLFAMLEKIGATEFIAKLLRPVVNFLFKGTGKETQKYISMNMSANLLGLGNASTPMGIKAINSMNNGKSFATTNMIMLVVISSTSLQILPSTVIGLRAAHGSVNPTAFLMPCIVATIVSTIAGILLVKIISRFLPDSKAEALPLAAAQKVRAVKKVRAK